MAPDRRASTPRARPGHATGAVPVSGALEGGSLADLFAAHHPERCDGLILYGAFAQFKHWIPDEELLQQLFDYIESDRGGGQSLFHFVPSVANDKLPYYPERRWR